MTIAERIKEILMPRGQGIMVKDVRIGLIYTAVMLEDGRTGMALTFHQGSRKKHVRLRPLYPLAGRNASEFIALLDSRERVATALGLATANALCPPRGEGLVEGDTLEFLQIRPGDRVGMVGLFAPMLPRLKQKTPLVHVFEQIRKPRGEILPEADAYRRLPECRTAIITSTSIVNGTVDRLLMATRGCEEVALVGASTPLLAEAFADTGVTLLSGIEVCNPKEILRIVSEGGGTRAFKEHVRKVNLLF